MAGQFTPEQLQQMFSEMQALQQQSQKMREELLEARNLIQNGEQERSLLKLELTAAQAQPKRSGTPKELGNRPPLISGDKNFLGEYAQLKNWILLNDALYPTDKLKIAAVFSFLTGFARKWYLAEEQAKTFEDMTYDKFMAEFKRVHRPSDIKNDAIRRLKNLKQKGRCSQYSAEFRNIAVDTGLNDDGLLQYYRSGLKKTVRDLIITTPTIPETFVEYVQLATRLDDRIYDNDNFEKDLLGPNNNTQKQNKPRNETKPDPDAMQLDAVSVSKPNGKKTALSHEEKQKRINGGLCLYCGSKDCPGARDNKNDPEACPKLIAHKAKGQGRH